MVIRSLVVAALFAGSAAAHANPVSTTNSGVLGGWTLSAGSVSVVGALDSLDAIISSGNWAAFNQAWSMHTTVGNFAGASAVLFAPNANGGVSSVGLKGGGSASAAPAAPSLIVGGNAGGGSNTAPVAGSGGASVGGSVGGGDFVVSMPGVIDAMPDTMPVDMPVTLAPTIEVSADLPQQLPAVHEVPEPGTIGLMLAGLAGAGFMRRRRQK